MVLLRILAISLASIAPGDPSAVDEFVRALRELAPDARAKQLEERASELAILPGSTAAWLEIRAADALPSAEAAPPEPLSAAQHDLLARTASRLPREEAIRFVAERASPDVAPAWRSAAFDLLRWHASASEVPLLLELVRGPTGDLPSEGSLVLEFQKTLVEIVRRDARIYDRLGWLSANAAPLRPTVVRALGIAGDPEALPHLASMLEDPEVPRVALQEISRLASRAAPDSRTGLAERVRPYLGASDRATRRHAIRALVALRDEKAVPALIELAGTGDERGHEAEFAALRELTGRNLPDQAGRWRRWHEEELSWLERGAPAALEALSSEQEAEVIQAIRVVSGHGLERERLAEAIARVLGEHSSAAVRGQACIGLERLRSTAGLEALAQALTDRDPSVGSLALNALRSITGLSLPWDARAWREALRSGS